ncbi:MAG: hypothetical protein A2Z83_04335 [Omnitrophica bacterium GWA2_52_8]|nr:MAG: hypothetical protein A2Z83_04335 [Omnitrophica bacterium GWA2_52_8]
MDDGVIKFQNHWKAGGALPHKSVAALIEWKDRLFQKGLLGVYPDGIGFGNLSARAASAGKEFIISGTQTSKYEFASADQFVRINHYDIARNAVWSTGPVKPSSESLTHAMLYDLELTIQAVIHVHHRKLWEALQARVPVTRADVPYGTPEMAHEVARLFREASLRNVRIFVMAGHEEGVVSFGRSLAEAGAVLFEHYEPLAA